MNFPTFQSCLDAAAAFNPAKTRAAVIFGFGMLSALASACLWDRDTLASEAKKSPQLFDAILGRMEIPTDGYYEKRIQRLEAISRPFSAEEFDDLAVAYEKTRQFEKAIQTLENKKKFLESKPKDLNETTMADHWYRYHANLGTVLVHQAMAKRNPLDRKKIELGIEQLKKSIEINPDAHFGREIVQVKILEMIAKDTDSQLEWSEGQCEEWEKFVEKEGAEKVQLGIIGMMRFGNGQDSPELLQLLTSTIPKQDSLLVRIANMRLVDLVRMKTLLFEYKIVDRYSIEDDQLEQIKADYDSLKKETAAYREKYELFMESNLATGRHPDTDPNFYQSWDRPENLVLKQILENERLSKRISGIRNIPWALMIPFVALLLAGPWLLMWIANKRQKR